jgi:hypothetical protein
MSLIRPSSLHEAFADRASRAPQIIDLAPEDWTEIAVEDTPVKPYGDLRTIASVWLLAFVLLLVIVAAPALEAAAHHLT